MKPQAGTDGIRGASPEGRRGPTVLRVAALLVLGIGYLIGARSLYQEWRLDFKWAPPTALPPEMSRNVAAIRSRMPDRSVIFYIQDPPDYWLSGLWQAALFPSRVVVVSGVGDLRSGRFAGLLAEGPRFAISAGRPPSDPGLRWSIPLSSLSGFSPSYEFGELLPGTPSADAERTPGR